MFDACQVQAWVEQGNVLGQRTGQQLVVLHHGGDALAILATKLADADEK